EHHAAAREGTHPLVWVSDANVASRHPCFVVRVPTKRAFPRNCRRSPSFRARSSIRPLITVWLEVRVLLAPPRTPVLTEISRGLTNTPRFAGARGRPAASAGKKDPGRWRALLFIH